MFCDFGQEVRTRYRCSRCGREIESLDPPWRIRARCKKPDRGFGDTLARWLGKLGISKRPGCGCEARQEKLNEWLPYSEPTAKP